MDSLQTMPFKYLPSLVRIVQVCPTESDLLADPLAMSDLFWLIF